MENKEIELKFEIKSGDVAKYYLSFLTKFFHRFSGYEKNEMYDLDNLLDKDDARLRLRKTTRLDGGGETVKLTYKKPLTRKGIKVEIEHETGIESYDNMLEILKAIGFCRKSSYEKFRHSFSHEKELIEIDVYPFATFVEIEGRKKEIVKLAEELGFKLDDNLTDSCDTIDDNRRKAQGLNSRDEILFDDLKGATDEQSKIIKINQK